MRFFGPPHLSDHFRSGFFLRRAYSGLPNSANPSPWPRMKRHTRSAAPCTPIWPRICPDSPRLFFPVCQKKLYVISSKRGYDNLPSLSLLPSLLQGSLPSLESFRGTRLKECNSQITLQHHTPPQAPSYWKEWRTRKLRAYTSRWIFNLFVFFSARCPVESLMTLHFRRSLLFWKLAWFHLSSLKPCPIVPPSRKSSTNDEN